MKRIFYIILITISAFSSSGCLRTYYPMLYETSAPPMVFETANKDTLSSKYAGCDFTLSSGQYENEKVQILKGYYLIAMTKNYINTNSRLYGYSGIYDVSGLEEYNGLKYGMGIGADFSLNINFKIRDFRFGIGGNIGITHEFGSYYNFRRNANSEGLIKSEIGPVFITGSVFPVIAHQISNESVLSAQLNVGVPGLISPTVVLNNNNYVCWLSWFPDEEKESSIGRRIVFGFMVNLHNL